LWSIAYCNQRREMLKIAEVERKIKKGFGQPEFNHLEKVLFRALYLENLIYSQWFRLRYRDRVLLGKNCQIHAHSFILRGTGTVEMGNNVIVERGLHRVFFNLEPLSRVRIGDNTWFQTYESDVIFSCKSGAEISLGKNCWFAGGHLSASQRITIGEHTLIGRGCHFLDSDLHKMDNDSELKTAPITIGSHCWFPCNIIVLKGVTIGDHCVIGSGSIVMDDIPDQSFAAGIPARIIRKINDRDKVP